MLTRIRDVRKSRRLTLAQVAERCSPPTTAQTIGRLETGMRTVSVGWLNRIAKALGVEPSELVTLPDRHDVPVAAILTPAGAAAPPKPAVLLPPAPSAVLIGLRVEVTLGDYRAGDQLWLEQIAPDAFAAALNRDVLVPRPAGRFAFGRLAATELEPARGDDGPTARVNLLPLTPGARQQVVAGVSWVAVARTLIRGL
jgi:transcriptional regulator with XRE-family HTH domain